jgi:hypothetical protein
MVSPSKARGSTPLYSSTPGATPVGGSVLGASASASRLTYSVCAVLRGVCRIGLGFGQLNAIGLAGMPISA